MAAACTYPDLPIEDLPATYRVHFPSAKVSKELWQGIMIQPRSFAHFYPNSDVPRGSPGCIRGGQNGTARVWFRVLGDFPVSHHSDKAPTSFRARGMNSGLAAGRTFISFSWSREMCDLFYGTRIGYHFSYRREISNQTPLSSCSRVKYIQGASKITCSTDQNIAKTSYKHEF